MISLFLLIFAFQNGLATEDADLRQMVNSLQLTVNEMNGKVMHLENEVKVRVVPVIFKTIFCHRNGLCHRLCDDLFKVVEK